MVYLCPDLGRSRPRSKGKKYLFNGLRNGLKGENSSFLPVCFNFFSKIAEARGMTPTQMALAWCYHREHVASTIIGATSIEQLDEDISAYDIRLDEETLSDINRVYKKYTDPTKFA